MTTVSSASGSGRSAAESVSASAVYRSVVWLRGEHDISTVTPLYEALAEAIAIDDADVVVDLGGVTYMSAATLNVLLRARSLLQPQSRSLRLRSASGIALRLLEVCGLTSLLGLPPDPALHPAGPAAALGTWVVVPVTARVGDGAPTATPPTRAGVDRSSATIAKRPSVATAVEFLDDFAKVAHPEGS